MAEHITMREFARRKGVPYSSVQHAVSTGRIKKFVDTSGNPKIDYHQAMVDWDANTDTSMNKKAVPGAGTTFAAARAVREEYNARLAKMEFEEKSGKLIEADKVKLEAFQAARLTRDIILNIPNKISHELAVETNPTKIHIMLTKALVEGLEELVAEGERRMSEKSAR